MIPQERPLHERGDLPPLKDFDTVLLKRLRALSPRFVEIRTSMGIGSEVGFGSFPAIHGKYSIGALGELGESDDSVLSYYRPGDFFGSYLSPISGEEQQRIIVEPDLAGANLRLVSIYQPEKGTATNDARVRLLSADNKIYEGVIAHELAHLYMDGHYPLSQDILEILMKRRQDMSDCLKDMNLDPLEEFDATDEAEIDLIACSFGYKSAIIAKLLFVIGTLETYPRGDIDDVSNHSMLLAESAQRSCRARLKEVNRYYP